MAKGNIMVVGNVGAGRSTLLNAVLSREIASAKSDTRYYGRIGNL